MTRKQITLPSGATVLVRKMSQFDFIELGQAPAALHEPTLQEERRAPTPEQLKWQVGVNRAILCKCTGPVCFEVGSAGASPSQVLKRRIVDKPFAECGEGELSIDEMADDDATAILEAVTELTKAGREAGRAARPFPAESGVAAESGSNGAAVSSAADGLVEPLPR